MEKQVLAMGHIWRWFYIEAERRGYQVSIDRMVPLFACLFVFFFFFSLFLLLFFLYLIVASNVMLRIHVSTLIFVNGRSFRQHDVPAYNE